MRGNPGLIEAHEWDAELIWHLEHDWSTPVIDLQKKLRSAQTDCQEDSEDFELSTAPNFGAAFV